MELTDKQRRIIVIAVAILVVLLLVLMVIAFFNRSRGTNNNGRPSTNNNNNNGTSNQKITLNYWGLWEPDSVMESLIKRYEDANPNITINYDVKTGRDYESLAFTRVQQASTEQSPIPDIIRINNTWIPKFQPYLASLPSDIFTATQFRTEFYPTHVADLTGTDNKIYAIPLEIDGLVLYYNKTLFEQAGLEEPASDWETLRDQAKLLTKTDASGQIQTAGIGIGTANNVLHSVDIFNLLLLQNGVEVMNADRTKVNLTSTEAVEAMKFYAAFTSELKVWSPSLRSDLEMFFGGRLAMMVAPSWRTFDILTANSAIEFDTVPVPQIGGDSISYAMYWAEAVPSKSENKAEAWKFIKYLSEAEQLKDFYSNASEIRAFGEPYSRQSLGSELTGAPYVGAVIDSASYMMSWPMGEQSFIESELKTAINSVANGQDPAFALKTAQDNINEELASGSQ